jgi:hypothetical protein
MHEQRKVCSFGSLLDREPYAATPAATFAGVQVFRTGMTSLANSRIEASAFASGMPPKRNELFSS